VLILSITQPSEAQETILRAGTLLDGRGGVSRSVNVVVEQTLTQLQINTACDEAKTR
jgi:hypothetical protein